MESWSTHPNKAPTAADEKYAWAGAGLIPANSDATPIHPGSLKWCQHIFFAVCIQKA